MTVTYGKEHYLLLLKGGEVMESKKNEYDVILEAYFDCKNPIHLRVFPKKESSEYSGVAEPYFPLKKPPIIPMGRANLSANKSQ